MKTDLVYYYDLFIVRSVYIWLLIGKYFSPQLFYFQFIKKEKEMGFTARQALWGKAYPPVELVYDKEVAGSPVQLQVSPGYKIHLAPVFLCLC